MLDPPGLNWDTLLKKTGIELELLTNLYMDLFIEKRHAGQHLHGEQVVREGQQPVGADYDPTKPNKFITYLDANNLYGWVMSLPLPKGGFKWKRVMPTQQQIFF